MEEDIFMVKCHHCERDIDPHEETVYVWGTGPYVLSQFFVCEGCDSEHRQRYTREKE